MSKPSKACFQNAVGQAEIRRGLQRWLNPLLFSSLLALKLLKAPNHLTPTLKSIGRIYKITHRAQWGHRRIYAFSEQKCSQGSVNMP